MTTVYPIYRVLKTYSGKKDLLFKPYKFLMAMGILFCTTNLVFSQQNIAQNLLDVINSNQSRNFKNFISKNVDYQNNDQLFGRWEIMLKNTHKRYGRLSLLSAEITPNRALVIYCKSDQPDAYFQWVKIKMQYGDQQKFIRAKSEWVFDPEVKVPAGKVSIELLTQLTKEYVTQMASSNRFSGTVLLAREGKILYDGAFGWADKDAKKPMRKDTKLNLASTTKIFTGIAISQLVQQGKLTYDTQVGEILPYFKNKGSKSRISIHQLLTHTSGLGDFWSKFDVSPREKILSCQDYFDLVKNDALLFEPGKGKRYSNVGFIVLGLIIEKITGKDYKEYVKENIFSPAGMKNTDFYSLKNLPENIAHGYYFKWRGSRHRISNHDHKPIHGSPQGGVYSTLYDLLNFQKALNEYKILDKKYVELMTSPKVELYPGFQYGYSFQCPLVNGKRYIGHDGGSPGISAEFRMFPEDKLTLIVLSNFDMGADELAEFVTMLISR